MNFVIFAIIAVLIGYLILHTKLKYDPKQYNLLHFYTKQFSEAFDGNSTCSDGWTEVHIMYKDKGSMDFSSALRIDCSVALRNGFSTEFFPMMLRVSEAYKQALFYARYKSGLVNNEKYNNNRLCLSEDALAVLKEHPQFKKIISIFKLDLKNMMNEAGSKYVEIEIPSLSLEKLPKLEGYKYGMILTVEKVIHEIVFKSEKYFLCEAFDSYGPNKCLTVFRANKEYDDWEIVSSDLPEWKNTIPFFNVDSENAKLEVINEKLYLTGSEKPISLIVLR